jgi:hypothetical protein
MAVYFFKHYLVVSLSAAPERAIRVTGLEVLNLVIAHALLVGLLIALIARRSVAGLSNVAARRTSRAANLRRNWVGLYESVVRIRREYTCYVS